MNKDNGISIIRYLSHFVTRAFLISVLCVMFFACFIILCYFGDLLLTSSKGNQKSPLFGAYVIVSPSMVPTIKINDAIIIKRIDNDKYKVGDIITFSSSDVNYEGEAVTHRIVAKDTYSSEESIYTTKGDNNSVVDPTSVKTDAIYGRVMFKVPAVGYVQTFLSRPSNFFLSLLIPAIIFIVYDLGRIFTMLYRKKA